MPKSYSSEQKSDALDKLRINGGDIALTHLQTGIPERTLRDWRRALMLIMPPPPPPTPIVWRQNGSRWPFEGKSVPSDDGSLVFDSDLEALTYLRRQIMSELINIASAFQNTFHLASPYQRVLVLSQLLDRLMKLDHHIKPYVDEEVDIEYVLSDDVEEEDDEDDFEDY